jgi:hypothetical protein
LAEVWFPRFIAAWMCSLVQSGPHSTGHPLFAYSSRSGAAGCDVEKVRGHISPIFLPAVSLIGTSEGNDSSFSSASAIAASCSSGELAYRFMISFVVGRGTVVFGDLGACCSLSCSCRCIAIFSEVFGKISSFSFLELRNQTGRELQDNSKECVSVGMDD